MSELDPAMIDPFARIAIQPAAVIYVASLETVKARHGCVVHLYCDTEPDMKFYAPYPKPGLVDSIPRASVLYLGDFDRIDMERFDPSAIDVSYDVLCESLLPLERVAAAE